MSICVSSAGDLGDIAYLLCVLKDQPGGPHKLLLKDDGRTCGIERRAHIIIPLAESQPYVKVCRIATPADKIDWYSGDFRKGGFHSPTTSLIDAHCRHGMSVGAVKKAVRGREAWLQIDPEPGLENRVVINRTERWQNQTFPWREVVQIYGASLLFIGHKHEHELFCMAFGPVEYRTTKDLLEVAQVIAGSWLFIGNQSSCWGIAEGMKHRRILEVCAHQTDCIYGGGFVRYCIDGEIDLPLPDCTDVRIESKISNVSYQISTATVPPGGWRYPGLGAANIFHLLQESAIKTYGGTPEEAKKKIIEETFKACPEFFNGGAREDIRRNLVDALRNSM